MTMRILPTDDDEDPEWSEKQVKLENPAVQPFDTWSDWHSTGGEAVITFMTMEHHLFNEWENQAAKSNTGQLATIDGEPVSEEEYIRVFEHHEFNSDSIRGPGVYRDSQNLRDPQKVDETYTIIVPSDFMTQKMCDLYIEKLNEKFGRNFVLEEVDQKARKADMRASFAASEMDYEKEELEEILEKVYKT